MLLDDGVNEYIYGNDRTPVAQISKNDGTVTYLHSDTIGSVMASTDSSGVLIANTEYSPYGVNLGLVLSPFGFAGEWTDSDTKHSYLRARWLDTTTGTFLSRDPMVQRTSDAYGYSGGNPISRVDPLGLDWVSDVGSGISDSKEKWLSSREFRNDLSTGVAIVGAISLAIVLAPVAIPGAAAVASIAGLVGIGMAGLATIDDCAIAPNASSCIGSISNLAFSITPVTKFRNVSKLIKRDDLYHKNIENTLGEFAKNGKYFEGRRITTDQGKHNGDLLSAKFGYFGISNTALINDTMGRLVNNCDFNLLGKGNKIGW